MDTETHDQYHRHMEWTLLAEFESQTEARVVESFLRAHGFDVRLLDTHMQGWLPVQLGRSSGMRLLVPARDVQAAREALASAQRSTHLSLIPEAGESPPPVISGTERLIIALLIALAIVALLATHVFSGGPI
ncbi:MAG: DUF2007 domain-containing protein [Bdellovibrionales bacterium]